MTLTEDTQRLLNEDRLHSHSDRGLASLTPPNDHADIWRTNLSECGNLLRLDFEKDQQRFHQECVLGSRPAIITGVVEASNWRAAFWSDTKALVEQRGHLMFDVKAGVPISLEQYIEYTASNCADFPYYLAGRGDFKGQEALLDDFAVPEWFADDVYDWCDMTGRFRYFLCGGQRTGTNIHTDPLSTCAWNTSLFGHKRWVCFPPGNDDQYKAMLGASEEYQKTPPAYWFMDVYPFLKQNQEDLGMVEFIQRPGETVFVPAEWWHTVLNLDLTIAVTANHLLPSMLPAALKSFEHTSKFFGRMLRKELRKLTGRKREIVDQVVDVDSDSD